MQSLRQMNLTLSEHFFKQILPLKGGVYDRRHHSVFSKTLLGSQHSSLDVAVMPHPEYDIFWRPPDQGIVLAYSKNITDHMSALYPP